MHNILVTIVSQVLIKNASDESRLSKQILGIDCQQFETFLSKSCFKAKLPISIIKSSKI